ncbi:hypothetical protein MICRO11B_260005 [Micrococcus luteus]|nr:hypothetical protein MICRO11B_260005 [Micrococcus luteus]
MCHPERARRVRRADPAEERGEGRGRGREHALHRGGRPPVRRLRDAVRPGQGRQRGRRGDVGAGDAAERLAGLVELRLHPRPSRADHARHPRPLRGDRRGVRHARQLRGGGEHRRVHQGRRRDDRPGRGLSPRPAPSVILRRPATSPPF